MKNLSHIRYTAVPLGTKPGMIVAPLRTFPPLSLRQTPNSVLPVDALTIVGRDKWVDDFLATTPQDTCPWVIARVDYHEGDLRAQVTEIKDPSYLNNRFSVNWLHLKSFLKKIIDIESSPSSNNFEDYGNAMERLLYTDEWNENIWQAKNVMQARRCEHQWELVYEDLMGTELHALAARHRLVEGTAWDQAAYDMITTPYRKFYGPIHPDDAPLSGS